MSNWKVGPGGRLYHPTTGAYVGQLDDNGNEQFVLSAFPSDQGVKGVCVGDEVFAPLGNWSADFSRYADGDGIPGVTLWQGTQGPDAKQRVVSGKLTYVPASAGAGYMTRKFKSTVKKLSAKFSFGSYSTNNGSAVLIAWNADYEQTYPTIPNSACHLTITPAGWNYSVFVDHSIVAVAYGTFTAPLTVGQTYSAEVVIDPAENTAYVSLPDNTVRKVTHAQIGLYSPYAVFENFRTASTDSISAFSSCFASDQGDIDLTALKRATAGAASSTGAIAIEYAPATAVDAVAPTSAADVDAANMSLSITIPASGKVLVEVSAFLMQTAASTYVWKLVDGANASLGSISVSEAGAAATASRPIYGAKLISGRTPGEVLTIKLQHFATVAASCTLRFSEAGGRRGVMKASPI